MSMMTRACCVTACDRDFAVGFNADCVTGFFQCAGERGGLALQQWLAAGE